MPSLEFDKYKLVIAQSLVLDSTYLTLRDKENMLIASREGYYLHLHVTVVQVTTSQVTVK